MDVKTGLFILLFSAGHSEGVTYIDTASDGYSLLTNSKDQTIKIWDVRTFSDENSAIQQQSRISDNRNRLDYRYDQPENWGFGRVIERKPRKFLRIVPSPEKLGNHKLS